MKILFKRIGAAGLLAAVLAGVTSQEAYAQATIPRPTPPPQPAIPAGLVIGARTIDRQDVGEYFALHGITQLFPAILSDPAFLEHDAANVTVYIQHGRHGHISRSFAPMWLESDQGSQVSVCLGEGALSLDAIPADGEVVSVRVRDEQGGSVVVAQRAYRVGTQVESIDATVRVDERGRLLALPVVRLSQAADGTVTATRDGGFAESLTVEFRVIHAGTPAYQFAPLQSIVIPAGEAAAVLPIQAHAGDTLTLRAGNGYSPAPQENSDVIGF